MISNLLCLICARFLLNLAPSMGFSFPALSIGRSFPALRIGRNFPALRIGRSFPALSIRRSFPALRICRSFPARSIGCCFRPFSISCCFRALFVSSCDWCTASGGRVQLLSPYYDVMLLRNSFCLVSPTGLLWETLVLLLPHKRA